MGIPVSFFFFFFQAEDGIRDSSVTGVQTCALPIWAFSDEVLRRLRWMNDTLGPILGQALADRSEERRGGKEGRSRGSPHPLKKKDGRAWFCCFPVGGSVHTPCRWRWNGCS